MTLLRDLRGIGPRSAQWLESVGIVTEADLEALGAVEAYVRVKRAYPQRVSLNLLYGLQGALLGIPWNMLPPEMKDELRRAVERAL